MDEIDDYLLRNPKLLDQVMRKREQQEAKDKHMQNVASVRSPSDTTIYTQAVELRENNVFKTRKSSDSSFEKERDRLAKLSISDNDLLNQARSKYAKKHNALLLLAGQWDGNCDRVKLPPPFPRKRIM